MLILWSLMILLLSLIRSQKLDKPRGPWRLAYRVYNGSLYTWNSVTLYGHNSLWDLFLSTDSHYPSDPSSYEPFKSSVIQDWADNKISVQAIKLSFIKNNAEEAFIVFNGFGRTKSTWFSCDNILYSTYTDLPNAYIADQVDCPGTTNTGFPFSIQNRTFLDGHCWETTGWTVVGDTDLTWSVCSQYAPHDGVEPYFKYSRLTSVANLTTELDTAERLDIYLQVWDMVFKGIDGIKPSNPAIKNLTDLWLSDAAENENDASALTLTYSPVKMFKSNVINSWGAYYIDTVKYSMFDGGTEKAYVVFDGQGSDIVSWFAEDNIIYTNYDIDAHKPLDVCSIDGDLSRQWQIQKAADPAGCTDTDQLGWMLIKEPRNNGTCSWDTKQGKVKPYFLYNTQTAPANPENFQVAEVMSIFVHGWRLSLKVSAQGSVSPKSSIYNLWIENGTLNEDVNEAKSLQAGTMSYKAGVVDIWDSLVVRAVKVAAYKNGVEDFHIVFDALGKTRTSWFDCSRILYTSVTGLDRSSIASYTCSIYDSVSSISFLIGRDPTCIPMSAIGVFGVIDTDNPCSARVDQPQFAYSAQYDASISDVPAGGVQLADTFAIFLDMENCWDGLCHNGATCDDRAGYFTCFCAGLYYGETCLNLDGTYGEWTSWSQCTVTCAGGTSTRTRECVGVVADGQCYGASSESIVCNTDPCPIDGGFSEWTIWSSCSEECGTGSRSRSRDCNNPEPQYGGADCVGNSTQEELCNTHYCPIDGVWGEWTSWSACPVSCSGGQFTRTRFCENPAPQYGGQDCSGNSSETESCNTEVCPPVHGGWSDWTSWTECPVSCGKKEGQQSRNRTCDNPVPEWGGDDCVGDADEVQYCNDFCCPVDGGWDDWGAWSTCYDLDNAICGNGLTVRTRTCGNPPAQYGGQPCTGDSAEIQICLEQCAYLECDPDNPSVCEMKFPNSGVSTFKKTYTITLLLTMLVLLIFRREIMN